MGVKNNNENSNIKSSSEQGFVEKYWEIFLWSTRYVVILAVFFSVLASITLFVVGSYEIIHTIIFDNLLAVSKFIIKPLIPSISIHLSFNHLFCRAHQNMVVN